MAKKEKITYLDLVIPLVCIYSSGLFFWSYFLKEPSDNNPFLDIFVIFTTSTFFTYGVFAFIRDISRFGIKWIIKSWKNK